MTSSELNEQILRLKTKFGEKAFDVESVALIRREVINMRGEEFRFLVDGLISTRLHSRPPLVSDFRDARLAVEKRILEATVSAASRAMSSPVFHSGLKSYLEKEFPGCRTLNEAVEVRRLQIQVAKANDPSYDPMEDPKWQ